jgi:hypothetical protein
MEQKIADGINLWIDQTTMAIVWFALAFIAVIYVYGSIARLLGWLTKPFNGPNLYERTRDMPSSEGHVLPE